jgi:D-beta-D-heptose 7-phosphate kinase/D-beta-D-heptose 1-phosphate adenosyltransferase
MKTEPATHRGKIVGIGDFLVDVWWQVNTADRNIEHAAVAICSLPGDCQVRPGGVGLLMNAIGRLGFSGVLLSTADNKLPTQIALSRLDKAHIDVDSRIIRDSDFVTPVKTRYVNANGHILVRHDSEVRQQASPRGAGSIDALTAECADARCVVVSDYGKNCIPEFLRSGAVSNAKACGVPVFVDAKPQFLANYIGADMVKINMSEMHSFALSFGYFSDVVQKTLSAVAAGLRTTLLVVTDGSRGVWHVFKQQAPVFVRNPSAYTSGNCVGAGDMFLAGLVLGYSELGKFAPRELSELEVHKLLQFGFTTAGQHIRNNSTKAVSEIQVLKEVSKRDKPLARLMAVADFVQFAKTRRAAGFKVVFTNGCFDLLHGGHRTLLRSARAEGDVLVVAVDSDDNVRRNKGENRPIQDQLTRAENIAALSGVDAVCVFDDADPAADNALHNLIRTIQPDVLVKGAEYAGRLIVGSDDVMKQDVPGRVVLVPMLAGASTTALVTKMKA